MNPKSGMTYALEHFSELARVGIGISRREVTKGTERSSPFIHSWDTFDRYLGICKEFVLFCRNQGVNKLHKLHYDTVEAFLMAKIEKERVKNTLKANMCALQKFFNGCNRPDLRDQLAMTIPRFKELANQAAPSMPSTIPTGSSRRSVNGPNSPPSSPSCSISPVRGSTRSGSWR